MIEGFVLFSTIRKEDVWYRSADVAGIREGDKPGTTFLLIQGTWFLVSGEPKNVVERIAMRVQE